MKIHPPGVENEPILCPFCLSERRAQPVWLDQRDLLMECPVHGSVLTAQIVDAIISGEG